MISSKPISRKKSTNLISTKQSQPEIQRKTSTALLPSSKPKKQQKSDQIVKKTKQQKKLVHSTSKGKLNRKHTKSERTDENFNSLNHKKSVQKIQYASKPSKEVKTKRISEQMTYEKKQEKPRVLMTEHTLTKTNSEAKLNVKKSKKRTQTKQLMNYQEKEQQKQRTYTKTLHKNPTSKKTLTTKSKLKQPSSGSTHVQSQQNIPQRKSTKPKPKLTKNKISQIIQKSILYSEVNYEFKQQISLLGSGIKKQQDFFIPYPFHSSQSEFVGGNRESHERQRVEHNAAVMIQKHFRGYIHRKYIEEARYIIDSIKKIQRFWRRYLERKRLQKKKEETLNKPMETGRGETSTSLITIKDFNDTCRLEKRPLLQGNSQIQDKIQSTNRQQLNKDTLKDIIKNLLSQESVNENLKEKIRTAMLEQATTANKKPQPQQKKPHPTKQLTLKTITQENDYTFEKSRESYVKNKLHTQINSQRCFNSPMSASSQFLTSPMTKKPASPKCLSSSYSKQVKANYNNYFKSNKNVNFSSPNKLEESNTDRKMRSHSGSKRQSFGELGIVNRENISHNIAKDLAQRQSSQNVAMDIALTEIPFEFGRQSYEPQPKLNDTKMKQDYLFNAQISTNSPIFKCQDQSVEDINLLSSQKIQLSTRRAPRPSIIKPFPTEFAFIEQFCLIITDYLREQPDTTQIFMQKVKGLKYFKVDNIFKQWQSWQFEEVASENQTLKQSLMRHSFQRPSIFSRSQKNLIVQFPSLRVFLNENDYPDQQIFNQKSPHHSYIKFMFDAFEQCLYQNFRHVSLNDLPLITLRQTRPHIDYLSIVFSETMANMLKSAQMLCGSFETQDMTEVEKQQRRVMNDLRQGEAMKEFAEERFEVDVFDVWIKMLLGKVIVDELVREVSMEMFRK